jgi:peptidoglycan DL-endopeptidase CwlO
VLAWWRKCQRCLGSQCFSERGRNGSARRRLEWDSRECPGPTTEDPLSRPSPRRVLTAGALVLAVIVPTVDTVEAEAAPPAPQASPAPVVAFGTDLAAPDTSLLTASRRPTSGPRVSRTGARRPAGAALRRRAAAIRRRTAARVRRRAVRAVPRRIRHSANWRRAARTPGASRDMSAVIAYARAQIGKRYVSGAAGPNAFDCSGLTMRAYARAGLRLPHSASAQAAQARGVSRSAGRPGDLVVGPGHVGVYAGRGMMIDAGNPRTGVVYRPLYAGLRIERF